MVPASSIRAQVEEAQHPKHLVTMRGTSCNPGLLPTVLLGLHHNWFSRVLVSKSCSAGVSVAPWLLPVAAAKHPGDSSAAGAPATLWEEAWYHRHSAALTGRSITAWVRTKSVVQMTQLWEPDPAQRPYV